MPSKLLVSQTMNYRYALIVVLLSNLSFSQLSVRNNNYIFVNDEIVFVEDDVNLNETDSRIYLRSEGQLIQGTGTTGNSGNGELSVYQEGNVDEYEYNYWCSPIAHQSSNTFGISLLNDAVNITASTPATFNHNSNLNGTSSPLNIEPYWIWKFITSDEYSEWIHVQGNTTINPGEGFTMKGTSGSGSAQQYDYRGKPNSGTIEVSVLDNQFTLVGNPYPSALDALEYIHDTENAAVITGTLFYWEQNPSIDSHLLSAYDGGYATYTINAAGTVETYTPATFSTYNNDGSINGASGTLPSGKRPRRYIPIGQGFMVEGTTSAGTPRVKAKNSHRAYKKESVPNDSTEFFRPSQTKTKTKVDKSKENFSKVPDDYKRFRINVDFNNTHTRQLVETFHHTATTGFDYGLESKINENSILNSDAHWTAENKSYLAEALPYDDTLKIPLVIRVSEDMPVTIRIADIQNFENDQAIYMHDLETDVFINLRHQDFNINLETGNYTNRFEITFSKNSLNIVEEVFKDFNVFHNNSTSSIKLYNPQNLEIESFSLFDISGRKVLKKRIASKKRVQKYSTKGLSDGIYVAKIELANNRVFSKKMVIANQ